MKKTQFYLLFILTLIMTACSLSGDKGLKQILSLDQAPVGVVFEVASGDEQGMKWVVPVVQSYSRQLKKKFPGIKLALVSHGKEQFQFTRSNIERYAYAHKQVKKLVTEEGMKFHICATYAASSGVKPGEFVEYVNVADRAPEQVKKYQEQGYIVLFLKKPVAK